MPELPEVETIRLGLKRLIVGKAIVSEHNYSSPKSFPNPPANVRQFLLGASVSDIRRRGKMLLIDLSSSYTLMIHLKMTGQLVYIGDDRPKPSETAPRRASVESASSDARAADVSSDLVSVSSEAPDQIDSLRSKNQDLRSNHWGGGHPNDSLVEKLPDNTTRQHLDFSDGSRLYFNDLRKFGYMKLVPTAEVEDTAFMKKIGPEPLENSFTGDLLFERLQRRKNTSIKAAILDQSVLAGVGNIYADESLWAAKIHPATPVRLLPKSSIQNLASEIISVLKLSIAKGGSTDKNYVDAEGKKGSYLKFAKVFRLEGQPCPRCGTTIVKIRVAGRGTHICPTCQRT